MKPFIVVDRFLLNRVEKLSHCLQKTFGLGCHKWAQLLYGGFIVNVITWLVIPDVLHGRKLVWLWVLIVPLYFFCYLKLMPDIEKMRGELRSMGIANSSKISKVSIVSRVLYVFWTASYFFTGIYAWGFSFALLTLSNYFAACDDLPPGKSRVRKFVDALKAFGMKPVSVQQ